MSSRKSSRPSGYTAEEILARLKGLENQKNKEGMARFGIKTDAAFGVSMVVLRDIAKEIGKDHDLALSLWDTGYHEARILAGLIDDPALATSEQLDRWVADFDSWDTCDQCCSNLFDKTPFALGKTSKWIVDDREFVRRAGFVMMACLAVHDKKAGDGTFEQFLPAIKQYSGDNRNFVRKAVNWALRQIGKRNLALNRKAVETALELIEYDSKSAKWIASDALRELQDEKVLKRLNDRVRKGG